MLGKVKKRVSRVGLQPVKIHFSVESQAISFPSSCLVADQAILSISLERKTKSVATGSFVYRRTGDRDDEIPLPKENLEMVAILYKDLRTGRFQQKSASLVLRELVKKGVLGQFNYNVIARCYLNLHEVANELGGKTSAVGRGIVKFDNLKGVVLKFTVTATVQSVDHHCQYHGSNDDAASEMSDASHLSELTTEAPNDGFTCSVPVFEAMPPPIGSYLDSINSGLQRMQESPEEEEELREGSQQEQRGSGGVENSNDKHSTPTASSVTFLPNTAALADFTAVKEMFAMYDQELQRRGDHIAQLERRLAEQSAQCSAYTISPRTDTATSAEEQSAENDTHSAPSFNNAHNNKHNPFDESPQLDNSGSDATALNQQINQLTVKLQQSHEHASRLRKALEEEMHMAREAAAVAASNAVLRSEVEDEYHNLLAELIATKMEKANLSMQLDAFKHKNHTQHTEEEAQSDNRVNSQL
eukprot:gene11426-13282_t